ncbi:MAG: hypothetical protein MRY83_08380 [Flavobacteriales bacterium]|nr:hypothetical protein [Flavobacteriales bacterium]
MKFQTFPVFTFFVAYILGCQNGSSQSARLTQFSSFCSKSSETFCIAPKSILNSVYPRDIFWIVEATIVAECGIQLYPLHRVSKDTLYVNTSSIWFSKLYLETGDTIERINEAEECNCAYEVKAEFNLREIGVLVLNGDAFSNIFKDE